MSHLKVIDAPDAVTDILGRPLRDLRISVTDRCNFRCVYCMPKEVFGRNYEFLAREELLTFEEIERLARGFAAHGGGKIRSPEGEGGGRVARLGRIDGLDVGGRTEAHRARRGGQRFRPRGLRRDRVSLDSLD